jgi:lipoyl-dependent peroxiredoxin
MTNVPKSILTTCTASAQGGRAGGKVALEGKGVWVHMEHDKALGGSGQGSTPEQLFAMGYASCFNSALLFVAGQQKIDAAKAQVTCDVGMGMSEAGGFALAVKLTVHVPGMDLTAARALVEAAHQVCPYSNATRGNVPVELVVV